MLGISKATEARRTRKGRRAVGKKVGIEQEGRPVSNLRLISKVGIIIARREEGGVLEQREKLDRGHALWL